MSQLTFKAEQALVDYFHREQLLGEPKEFVRWAVGRHYELVDPLNRRLKVVDHKATKKVLKAMEEEFGMKPFGEAMMDALEARLSRQQGW